nr:retrovirus-related Pol polyprotein from transposon TNT 1-94 [Tanacetum cinerariifolium]
IILLSSSIQQHYRMPGSTKFFTGSSKHLVFFFKLHGRINSKASSLKEMLRNCHGHNLSKGNIIKIFYHGLNEITPEVLNYAAGGFQSRSKQPNLDDDDIPMSREEKAKFMQTFCRTHFYNDYCDHDSNRDNWRLSERNDYNRDNYQSHSDDKPDLQKQLSDFIKSQHSTNSFVKDIFMDLKNKLETTTKNHQASIQNLEAKFDRFTDKQSGRPSGSLPINTQPNPKGSSSKPYQLPQAQNEHVNALSIQSGKSYNPPVNLNDQQNDYETPINFDRDDEDDEPQPKPKNPKPVKETPTPKPYKPKVPYPQCLRKEKIEDQYGKFLDMICAIRINNRVLVTKPHKKTPYELLHGRTPSIGFMRPFGCPVTILNTLDPLGKFEGKVNEGFLVGYSVNSKAFRVFNSRTRIVQETLHANFLENKPNIAGFQEEFDTKKAGEEAKQQYMLFPVWSTGSLNLLNKEGDAAFDDKEHDAEKPESAVNLSPSNSVLSGE